MGDNPQEVISKLKDVVSKYVPANELLSHQKLIFLCQRNVAMIITEGLKLLSNIIEVDSCLENGLRHNSKALTVEKILSDFGVTVPSLPVVVPDGFKFQDNILVLGESFVRVNPLEYDKKYREDQTKLQSIGRDLVELGIEVIVIIDGRTSYQNKILPDWVTETIKNSLYSLMKCESASALQLDQMNYDRLCDSLLSKPDTTVGLENIESLKAKDAEYDNELRKLMCAGIDGDMPPREVENKIILLYNKFKASLSEGQRKRIIKKTDRLELLREFCNLYGDKVQGDNITDGDEELLRACLNSNPIIKYCYYNLSELEMVKPISTKVKFMITDYEKLLSLLNKMKSSKLWNTRRKNLFCLDLMMLLKFRELTLGSDKAEKLTFFRAVGQGHCIKSVNDRMVSFKAVLEFMERKVIAQRKGKGKGNVTKGSKGESACEEGLQVISVIRKRIMDTFEGVFDTTTVKNLPICGYKKLLSYFRFLEGVEGSESNPRIVYTKSSCDDDNTTDPTLGEAEVLQRLSSLCLGLINSMKTSSISKTLINSPHNMFGDVKCKECFCQDIRVSNMYPGRLYYQKPGERARAYSVYANGEYLVSFTCNPSRYFTPIFSDEVLMSLIDTMMFWLKDVPELTYQMERVRKLLFTLIVLLLTSPSKRNQTQVQNVRYFVMAYVNEYHIDGLIDKLTEKLITESETCVYRLLRFLILIVFDHTIETLLQMRFKFLLNVSYLCHFITKETPDRKTDLLKCFEKFIEPKLKFDSVHVNCNVLDNHEKGKFLIEAQRFLSKGEDSQGVKYGVNKNVFSLMCSSFNNGSLVKHEEVKNFVPPNDSRSCALAMDLASNKSVMVPNKTKDGFLVYDYDFGKLITLTVSDLAEKHKNKGQYKKSDLRSKSIMGQLTKMVLPKFNVDSEEQLPDEVLKELSDISHICSETIKNSKEWAIDSDAVEMSPKASKLTVAILKKVLSKVEFNNLIVEMSTHHVTDIDYSIIELEKYQQVCSYLKVNFGDRLFRDHYETQCGISDLTRNLTQYYYEQGDFLECFKYVLTQLNAGDMVGQYKHKSQSRLGLPFDYRKAAENSRISSRESNSEALAKELDLTNMSSAALKNLCFFSADSPKECSPEGPDSDRLRFGLSFKEQVGGNRELYVGDLRTKMYTRLVEDYFENMTKNFKGSCLNDEKYFEEAVLSMKDCILSGDFCYSMDHSKWGPSLSPLLFSTLLSNLNFQRVFKHDIGKANVIAILNWHLHKLVEVPYTVANSHLASYLRRKLGLMSGTNMTLTEEFFKRYFDNEVIPSHVSSVLDMGQGILHNASDFYALISERFINYALECISTIKINSFTSSDDQISIHWCHGQELQDLVDVLEFHNYLSEQLNKFVSPKSCFGSFCGEFKSRFFVWGEEVPLLTKFVAASLHNIKCKQPQQICETVDTILEQSVANGVPVSIVNKIAKRTLSLIDYSQYPRNPWLINTSTDCKDWIDGSRGYRLQRNFERLFPDVAKTCRKMVGNFYQKIKAGSLTEEFLSQMFQMKPEDGLEAMEKLTDYHLESIWHKLCWFDANQYGPLRLVLRSKLLLKNRCLESDNLPSLVKTIQSKLSKNFTKGAQKLLSESMNKSAFQSNIASGFIGVCKSLGSKCVRAADGACLYMKQAINGLMCCSTMLKEDSNILFLKDKGEVVPYLRPIVWDYLCIVTANSFELGLWVLKEPKFELIKHCDGCNTLASVKPSASTLLEDRISINHIIHSIRRQFPELFEKFILPFLTDLAFMRLRWEPRIKFLDACVSIDIQCESLSLISHLVKHKRTENYVVLWDELIDSHQRGYNEVLEDRTVDPLQQLLFFKKQLILDSFYRPIVITCNQLRSYPWFPTRKDVCDNDQLGELGHIGEFIRTVVHTGDSRPMYSTDLSGYYMFVDIKSEDFYFNISTLHIDGCSGHSNSQMEGQETVRGKEKRNILEILKDSEHLTVELSALIAIDLKGGRVSERSLSVIMNFKGLFRNDPSEEYPLIFTPMEFSGTVSGKAPKYLMKDVLAILKVTQSFKRQAINRCDINLENLGEFVNEETFTCGIEYGEKYELMFDEYSYEQIGQEVEQVPLHLQNGVLYEGKKRIESMKCVITTTDLINSWAQENTDPATKLEVLVKLLVVSRQSLTMGVRIDPRKLEELQPGIIQEAVCRFNGWVNFGVMECAFSNRLKDVMYFRADGSFRLNGKDRKSVV